MEIVVVGMGYVGIPVAALFADVPGLNVVGLQRRSKRSGWKIDYINSGKSPICGDEPDLEALIKKVVDKRTLRATDDISVYEKADTIIITIQTPVDENHKPRYESLKQVCQDIGERIPRGAMVCLESTVAPGTTINVVKTILEEKSGMKAGEDFNLVYSYERVMVGRLLHNLKYMPKVVGGLTPECTRRGVEFYRKIVLIEPLPTDCMTAEVAKVTENAYRDVNIAFANEIAMICKSLGVNVHDVRRFVNSLPYDPSDPAKNPFRNMHIPGAGVGGHCLPKESWLLKYGLDTFGAFKYEPKILIDSRKMNDYMPSHMKELIIEALDEKGVNLNNARICVLGFAFLENSADTRNTPALTLYNLLLDVCKDVVVHDPHVKNYPGVNITDNLEEAFKDSNCLVIITRHKEYLSIKPNQLKDLLATPVIVDGRNVFNPEQYIEAGFVFKGVGIGNKKHVT